MISLAALLRLNKAIAFAFSNVSLPPFIPFVLYISSKVGQTILGTDFNYTLDMFKNGFEISEHLKTYLVGSFALATISAILLGVISFIFFTFFKKKNITLQNG